MVRGWSSARRLAADLDAAGLDLFALLEHDAQHAVLVLGRRALGRDGLRQREGAREACRRRARRGGSCPPRPSSRSGARRAASARCSRSSARSPRGSCRAVRLRARSDPCSRRCPRSASRRRARCPRRRTSARSWWRKAVDLVLKSTQVTERVVASDAHKSNLLKHSKLCAIQSPPVLRMRRASLSVRERRGIIKIECRRCQV